MSDKSSKEQITAIQTPNLSDSQEYQKELKLIQVSDDIQQHINVYTKYQNNDQLPVHASLVHNQADLDTTKPGGYFTKKLYVKEHQKQQREEKQRLQFEQDDLEQNENQESNDDHDSEVERLENLSEELNGDEDDRSDESLGHGKENKHNGFHRTQSLHRIHYKAARIRDKKTIQAQSYQDRQKDQSNLPNKIIRLGKIQGDCVETDPDEKEANKKAFDKFFNNQPKSEFPTLDGIKMIQKFVSSNPMTRWQLKKSQILKRENGVKISYQANQIRDNLPKVISPLQAAFIKQQSNDLQTIIDDQRFMKFSVLNSQDKQSMNFYQPDNQIYKIQEKTFTGINQIKSKFHVSQRQSRNSFQQNHSVVKRMLTPFINQGLLQSEMKKQENITMQSQRTGESSINFIQKDFQKTKNTAYQSHRPNKLLSDFVNSTAPAINQTNHSVSFPDESYISSFEKDVQTNREHTKIVKFSQTQVGFGKQSTQKKNNDKLLQMSLDDDIWTPDQIRQRILQDKKLGMEVLFRVSLKRQAQKPKLVAPFIDYVLCPPKRFVDKFTQSHLANLKKPEISETISDWNENRTVRVTQKGLKLMGSSPENRLPNFMHQHLSKRQAETMKINHNTTKFYKEIVENLNEFNILEANGAFY